MAERLKSSIAVNAPASVCYSYWHAFENLSSFMKPVKSVTRQGDNRWHWVVNGPLGQAVEWDAEVDGDEPNKLISWHTVSEPDVGVQGAVRFDEVAWDTTHVNVTIQYEPPAGVIGGAVADIFSNPQAMVDESLANFKQIVESVHAGTSSETATTEGSASSGKPGA